MPTVTGTLDNIIEKPEAGAVEVQICGYGGQVPRVNGVALLARLAVDEDDIPISSTGTFTFTVPGNDQIIPAGTYYAVTVRNANGDIAQVNAYRFLSTTPTYDLTLVGPYDPNQPPPPLPPLITNLLLILPPSNAMVFDGSIYTTFQTTLSSDVTLPTIQNMVPGNLYTFIIIQDGTGGHNFTWPANTNNAMYIDRSANSRSIQTCVAEADGSLWAISAGTYWP